MVLVLDSLLQYGWEKRVVNFMRRPYLSPFSFLKRKITPFQKENLPSKKRKFGVQTFCCVIGNILVFYFLY